VDAANALGVTPQQVYNLLRSGGLDGPRSEGKARRGERFVFSQSVEARIAARARAAVGRPPTRGRGDADPTLAGLKRDLDRLRDEVAKLRQRERSLRTALQHEKVAADLSRELARRERHLARRLQRELTGLLDEQRNNAELLDAAMDQQTEALTQLLAPDDVRDGAEGTATP
jgi:hypothetical protein